MTISSKSAQKGSPRFLGEAGFSPLLLLAGVTLLLFLLITSLAPFRNKVLSTLFPKQFSFAAAPAMTNITDNRSSYPNSQIPKYEKYEVSFSLTTTALNPQLPYDASPPAGVQPGIGVTVNAQFSQDNFATVYTQPAFYYQDFDYQQTASWDWFYPKNNFAWKVRFAPPKEGNWQYRLTAQDSGGSSTSATQTFTVASSANKGFVRVSPKDSRYFEFEDGTYFPGLGYNLPFNRIRWDNPILDNQANFQKMNQNGIQLVRHWLSDWGIFSAWGTPWASMLGGINDPGLSKPYYYNGSTPTAIPTFGGSDVSWELVKFYQPCIYSGWKNGNAFKPNTKYHVFVRYLLPQNMPAAVDPTKPHGLVVKSGPWFDGAGCSNPNNGTPVTTHVNQVSPKDGSGNFQWQISEGTFTTGTFDGEPYDLRTFYLALDNIDNTTNIDPNPGEVAVVDRIEIREEVSSQCAKAADSGALLDLSNGQCGANVMAKAGADALKYMDQRYSAAFDKVLDLAKQNNVYLKLVVLEKNEYIQNHVDYEGDGIIDWLPNCTQPSGKNVCPGNEWFYGNWGAPTKIYWQQQAWWRYLQARWGYSTNIHSFELMNEGDPFNSQHYTQAENFAQYMHQFKPNDHLVTTSNWSDLPHPFWKDPAYSSLDFADMHLYIPKDDAWNFRVDKDFAGQVLNPYNNQDWYDPASAVTKLSNLIGPKQQYGAGKPTIRGETGFVVGNSDGWTNDIQRDSKGLWVHDFVWAGINSSGLIESYWYATDHIYPQAFDNRGKFGDFYNFINNIPLNNGNYVDAGALATDSNVTVLGQKDTVSKRAHLWAKNKKHLWCGVIGSVPGCPTTWDNSRLNGTVTLSGFTPNATYPVEYWQFDNNVTLTKITNNVTADASGQLTLNLASLPATVTDVGIKVGDYTTPQPSPPPSGGSPSPSPSKPGDIDGNGKVDIFDYNILLTNFGKTGTGIPGDIDGNNKVDIFDYNILLTNFGK